MKGKVSIEGWKQVTLGGEEVDAASVRLRPARPGTPRIETPIKHAAETNFIACVRCGIAYDVPLGEAPGLCQVCTYRERNGLPPLPPPD